MKTLAQIGHKTGTDKVTHHGYHRFYPIFLEKYRDKKLKLLEIGIYEDKSRKLWEEYFPKATIYGIDIIKGYKFDRGEVFQGDQSDLNFLKKVKSSIGEKIDFILDDGSHKPEHQIKTFNYFFSNLLKKGGVYIIEDIETSYWKDGVCNGYRVQKGYKHKESVVEIFKDMIDKLNDEFVKDKSIFSTSPINKKTMDQIGLISFQYNSIIILKKDDSFKPYQHKTYRYAKNL